MEEAVDSWTAELWSPLKAALKQEVSKSAVPAGKSSLVSEEAKLEGVPALQPLKLSVKWLEGEDADVAVPDWPGPGPGPDPASGSFSSKFPFSAPVVSAKYLTAEWSDRVVIHLALLKPPGGNISASPGDSIGVLPENDPQEVEALLARLALNPHKTLRVQGPPPFPSHLPSGPTSLGRILGRHLDISSPPRKSLLRILAEFCSEPQERISLLRLSSRGGREEYKTRVQGQRLSLRKLLETFPSCVPPVSALLEGLSPLMPRFYSLSNDGTPHGSHLEVAFSVVREPLPGGGVFRGVATNWLERILQIVPPSREREFSPDSLDCTLKVPIFLKPGGAFHPPADVADPLILIGPGTGVAPFRGFLEARRRQLVEVGTERGGDSWLFFGCRREDEDFLYRQDLEGFVKDGTLGHLVVAFSRAQEEKVRRFQGNRPQEFGVDCLMCFFGTFQVYVQHKIKERGDEICSLLLNPKTHIFVCG